MHLYETPVITSKVNCLTFGFCGDVMIGRLIDEHGDRIWGDLLPILRSTDFNLANLEAALTHSEKIVPKVFNFKSDPKHVAWLKEAKFDIVNLANNHVLDYSTEGLLETLTTLDKAGILHVGAGRNIQEAKAPVIIEKNGIKIGIIGYTDNEPDWLATDNIPGVNFIEVGNLEQIKQDIAPIRNQVDILIVSQHIGPNMIERPPIDKIRFAHDLIDAGASIIHSHSSHIFQGVELYKNKIILYDTGDFVDDYYVDPYLRNDRSFFFLVELSKEGIRKLTLIPVFLSNLQVNLAKGDERQAAIQRMTKLSESLHTTLQPTEQGLELICY